MWRVFNKRKMGVISSALSKIGYWSNVHRLTLNWIYIFYTYLKLRILRVNWVRLGDLNIVSTTDDARPTDYRIAERVIHPEYKTISHYNDIALFRLEKDVQFSEYIWPICLNSNPSVDPTMQLIATGWGRTSDGMFSFI